MSTSKNRNSSIELLKIIAIFLIIINHVVQSASESSPYIENSQYVLNLSIATRNISRLLLSFFRVFGGLGNNVFFICSAWFFLDSKKTSLNKCVKLIADVWIISITILICVFMLQKGQLDAGLVFKQILPITYNNNWYITCYLLFYLLYPYLNKIIDNCDHIELLKFVGVSSLLYLVINYFLGAHYFTSILIIWVVIYFLLSYLKKYHTHLLNDRKTNWCILCFCIVGHLVIFLLTNYLGLKILFIQNRLLHWNNICSPFLVMIAISLFNLFKANVFKSSIINFVSNLSLYIYLIHENMLIRFLYRPYLWVWAYDNYGYSLYLPLCFIFTLLVFVLSITLSIAYSFSISKLTKRLADKVSMVIRNKFMKLEDYLLNQSE